MPPAEPAADAQIPEASMSAAPAPADAPANGAAPAPREDRTLEPDPATGTPGPASDSAATEPVVGSAGNVDAEPSAGGPAPVGAAETPPRQEEERDDVFQLKPLKFYDPNADEYRTVKILSQNKFGPCAALALCNVLILRGELAFEGEHVSFDTIAAMLGDLVVGKLEKRAAAGYGVDMSSDRVGDVLTVLPSLRHGLDINIYFNDIRGFEPSPALSVFSAFDVDLLHGGSHHPLCPSTVLLTRPPGWTVDPQDLETHDVVVRQAKSYNHCVEMLIDAETTGKDLDAPRPDAPAGSTRDLVATLHAGEVIQRFLNATSTQLTAHGLTQLSEQLPPFALAVFFRSNHFSTLMKSPQGELYTLCTDVGYATSGAAWESLNNFDGDTQLVDEFFHPYVASGTTPIASDPQLDQLRTGNPEEDADLALAISLQEEENRRAAELRPAPSPQPPAAQAAPQLPASAPPSIDQRLREVTANPTRPAAPVAAVGPASPPPASAGQRASPAGSPKGGKKKKDESSCTL
ncbi:hypothetical protein DFJ74DRAFT_684422, partial [Hyaloraphidium curvatum]